MPQQKLLEGYPLGVSTDGTVNIFTPEEARERMAKSRQEQAEALAAAAAMVAPEDPEDDISDLYGDEYDTL